MKPLGSTLLLSAAVTLALVVALPAAAGPPPAPWIVRDIGTPAVRGVTDVDANGVWTLQGSGFDLFHNYADNCHFAYQPVRGDASLTARFLTLEGGDPNVRSVGLTVRENDTPGSPKLFLHMIPLTGLYAALRADPDGTHTFPGGCGPSNKLEPNLLMRLQREGHSIAGFHSRDGRVWTQAFPPRALPTLGDEALFGLEVTSNLDGQVSTGKLDQVQVQPGATLVSGVNSCGGDRSVLLQWRPLTNAVAYNVYRAPAGATADRLARLNVDQVAGTSFLDNSPGLVNGTSMTYAVAAVFPGADGQPVEGPVVAVPGTPVAVPSGWLGCDINEGANGGSTAFDTATGEVTVRGSGWALGLNADGCYFVSQPVEGNFQITARLLSVPRRTGPVTGGGAFGGLMIRESLDTDARFAFGGWSDVDWPDLFFGLLSTGRGEAGGASPHANLIADDQLKLPIVLRLVRLGTVLRAEYSLDEGKTFRLGSRIFLGASPAKRLHAGLAVSSGDRSQIGEARFSGLEIKPR